MMNKQGMQYILRLPMLVSGGSMLCESVPLRKVPSSLHSTVLLEVQSAARLVNMTLHLDSALNLTESQLSPPTMKAEGIGLQTSRLQKQRSCLLFSACGLVRHEDVSNPMGFHVNSNPSDRSPRVKAGSGEWKGRKVKKLLMPSKCHQHGISDCEL